MSSTTRPRTRRGTLAALVAAAGLALPGAFTDPAAAAAPDLSPPARVSEALGGARPAYVDPNLTVDAVTLGRRSVAVAGLNAVPVPVTVRGRYVSPAGDPMLRDATVVLRHAPRSGTSLYRTLYAPVTLVSKGTQPGTWTGTLLVPSAADGTLTVTGVSPARADRDTSGESPEATPYAGPTLAVTGTHRPRMTAAALPDPFRRSVDTTYRIVGQVIDTATGAPYRHRVTVGLWVDGSCLTVIAPGCTTRSGTDGRFVFTGRNDRGKPVGEQWIDYSHIAHLQSITTDVLGNTVTLARGVALIRKKAAVSAVPSTTRVRTGQSFTVTGKAWEVPEYHTVAIQKLRGSSQWRTVATGTAWYSRRYAATVRTATTGRGIYRAYVAGGESWTTAASSTFVVTTR